MGKTSMKKNSRIPPQHIKKDTSISKNNSEIDIFSPLENYCCWYVFGEAEVLGGNTSSSSEIVQYWVFVRLTTKSKLFLKNGLVIKVVGSQAKYFRATTTIQRQKESTDVLSNFDYEYLPDNGSMSIKSFILLTPTPGKSVKITLKCIQINEFSYLNSKKNLLYGKNELKSSDNNHLTLHEIDRITRNQQKENKLANNFLYSNYSSVSVFMHITDSSISLSNPCTTFWVFWYQKAFDKLHFKEKPLNLDNSSLKYLESTFLALIFLSSLKFTPKK